MTPACVQGQRDPCSMEYKTNIQSMQFHLGLQISEPFICRKCFSKCRRMKCPVNKTNLRNTLQSQERENNLLLCIYLSIYLYRYILYTLTSVQGHSKDTPAEVKGGLFSSCSKDLNQTPSSLDLCPSNPPPSCRIPALNREWDPVLGISSRQGCTVGKQKCKKHESNQQASFNLRSAPPPLV